MKKFRNLFALVLGSLLFAVACNTSQSDNVKLIPADSFMVMSFDFEQLMSKADMDRVKEMNIYAEMMEEIKSEDEDLATVIEDLLMDPTTAGIDPTVKAYLFVNPKDTDFDEVTAGMAFAVSDAAKLRSFIEGLPEMDEVTIESNGSMDYINPDDEFAMGWTESSLLLVGSDDDAMGKLEACFSQQDNIGSNKSFQGFAKESNDIGFWLQFTDGFSEAIMEEVEKEAFGMVDMDKEMFIGNSMNASLNFENGSVRLDGSYDLTDKMYELFPSLKDMDNISSEVLDVIPSEDLLGMYAVSYNMQGLKESLEAYDMEEEVNDGLKQADLTIDEVVQMLTGDIAIALVGWEEMEITTTDWEKEYYGDDEWDYDYVEVEKTEMRSIPIFVGAIGIGDKEIFDKVFTMVKMFASMAVDFEQTGDYYTLDTGEGYDLYIADMEEVFCVTNGEGLIQDIVDGNVKSGGDVLGEAASNTVYAYLDLSYENLPEEYKEMVADEMGSGDYMAFEDVVQNFEMIEIKGDGETFGAVLNLREKDENSLFAFIQMIEDNME